MRTDRRAHVAAFPQLRRGALLCTLLGLLNACGYQLQRPFELQAKWQPIFIEAGTEQRAALRSELLAAGLQTTRERKRAGSILDLKDSGVEQRSLSISFDGREAELLRSLEASLSWRDANGAMLAQAALRSEQSQLASPERRAAQQREAAELDALLRADIASQALALIRSRHSP